MAGHIFISEVDPPFEAVRSCISRLGGPGIVTAIRLCTQPSHVPHPITLSEHWPLVIEIKPSIQRYTHVHEVRVRNLRIGISSQKELDIPLLDEDFQIDELLKWLGFDIPDLYYNTFKGDRIEKVAS